MFQVMCHGVAATQTTPQTWTWIHWSPRYLMTTSPALVSDLHPTQTEGKEKTKIEGETKIAKKKETNPGGIRSKKKKRMLTLKRKIVRSIRTERVRMET